MVDTHKGPVSYTHLDVYKRQVDTRRVVFESVRIDFNDSYLTMFAIRYLTFTYADRRFIQNEVKVFTPLTVVG